MEHKAAGLHPEVAQVATRVMAVRETMARVVVVEAAPAVTIPQHGAMAAAAGLDFLV